MYLITQNKMILKVREPKDSSTTNRLVYVLWWRTRTVNWPALLKVKLPKRFYGNRQKKRKVFLYRLHHSGGRPVTYANIDKGTFLLKTSRIEDVLEFVCENEYPKEIIDHFIAKI